LNRRTYEQAGVDTPGNTPGSTKEPAIGWMTAFLFVTSFVGLLALVPIRKVVTFRYSIQLNDFHDFCLHLIHLMRLRILFDFNGVDCEFCVH
jgi:hypothetical protein